MKITIVQILAGLSVSATGLAIDMEKVELKGYGSIIYSNYDYLQNYQQDPKNRSKIDLERFVLAPVITIDERTKIEAEIEFEHGGTGSTMEYDTLDEFGEFEVEVEKGGEVLIEELYIEVELSDLFNYKIGHMVIPVGLNSQRHRPTQYLSTLRNVSETSILPDSWHESGFLLFGKFAENLHYKFSLTNGLNSEFFNSSQWIKAGHQKRFESVNADDLAAAFRLDYGDKSRSHIGFSLYAGNSSKNRNKSDINGDARVTITDIHGVYDEGNLKLRGLYLLGQLSDSEEITILNKTLPSALEAKKSPVASAALAYFLELGYDVSQWIGLETSLVPFFKYDFVDSMYETTGDIPDLDRYERRVTTIGLNYEYNPHVVYKLDYATIVNGDSNIKDMNAFNLAAGLVF